MISDVWKLENEANQTIPVKYLIINRREETRRTICLYEMWCYLTAFGTYARHNRQLYYRRAELFDKRARPISF